HPGLGPGPEEVSHGFAGRGPSAPRPAEALYRSGMPPSRGARPRESSMMAAGSSKGAWMAPILTAVFPVAGRGTRFLPATKASPKEMLPIVDKPLIQYAAEEALQAGARKLVFITGSSKRAIEDHFDSDHELEEALKEQGKHELLATLKSIVP